MNFALIGDSFVDLNEELNKTLGLKKAPLKIILDGITYVDDENLNVEEMANHVRRSENVPKTSAPSPGDFMKYIDETHDGAFIITISSRLSGTYNSAITAQHMCEEKYPGVKVHVFDSLGATGSETTLAIKIRELIDRNLSYEEIVEEGENFIRHLRTRFLLEDISHLQKNGRLPKLAGILAQMLHIKPILGDDGNGEIHMLDKARTTTKALDKLVKEVQRADENSDTLVIAECFAADKAEYLKKKFEELGLFKNIQVVSTRGASTIYTNFGGVVCGF